MTAADMQEMQEMVTQCRVRDMSCIAYAYRPLEMSPQSSVLSDAFPITTELPFRRNKVRSVSLNWYAAADARRRKGFHHSPDASISGGATGDEVRAADPLSGR